MPQTLPNLPPDVLFCIFTRDEVELADILRLGLTCRSLRAVARHRLLGIHLAKRGDVRLPLPPLRNFYSLSADEIWTAIKNYNIVRQKWLDPSAAATAWGYHPWREQSTEATTKYLLPGNRILLFSCEGLGSLQLLDRSGAPMTRYILRGASDLLAVRVEDGGQKVILAVLCRHARCGTPRLVRITRLCTTTCNVTKAVFTSFEPLASLPLQSPIPFGEILSTSLIPKHDTMVLLFLSAEERITIACFNWNTGQTGYGVTLCHADTTRLVQCSVFNTSPETLTLYHQHNTFAYTSTFSLASIYDNSLEPIKPIRDHVWNFVDNQPRRSLLHYQTLHFLIQPMDPSGEKRHAVVTTYLDGLNEDEGPAPVHISYHPITLSSAPPTHLRRLWLPPCTIARHPNHDNNSLLLDSSSGHTAWIQCDTDGEVETRTLKVACWPEEEDMADSLSEGTCSAACVRTLPHPDDIDLHKIVDLKLNASYGVLVLTMDDGMVHNLDYAGLKCFT